MSKKSTTYYGRCFLCGYSSTKGGLTRHLKKHLAERQGDTPLLWLRVTDQTPYGFWPSQAYWLDLEMPETLPLEALDDFLRAVWVECCDHLSHFAVQFDGKEWHFRRIPFEHDDFPPFAEVMAELQEARENREQIIREWVKEGLPYEAAQQHFEELYEKGGFPIEVSMSDVTVGDLARRAEQWDYEYDYGTTTYLRLKVMARYQGPEPDPNAPIRILSRNYKPDIRCAVCGAPAAYWALEEGTPVCAQHLADEVDWVLPIVNSPRTGLCGYDGPSNPDLAFEEVYLPTPKK